MTSSTPVRRRSVATLLAAAAMIAAFILPAAASASHTAAMGPVELLTPGCQAKGQLAFAAGNSGALATGAYAYAVTAIVGTTETNPCGASNVAVNNGPNPTNTSQALILWDAVPGAVGYKIYRRQLPSGSFGALIFGGSPPNFVTTLPPGAVCPPGGTGTGSRCAFQDSGGPASGQAPPPFVAGWNGTERHPDVRMTQCVDYGAPALSACPNPAPSATDDPFTGDTGDTAPALKADVLHFPPGLTPNPTAASTCKLSGAAPSLIGDPNKFGSDDPDEDTCPESSQVGNATTLTRAATGLTLTGGSIYVGEPKAGEPGRLYIVLRPACSKGHPIAPGSATCNAVLGGPNREVEKEFIASASSFVKRSDGSYGIDAATVKAETDGPLEPYLNVLVPTPSLQRLGKTPIQVRQLVQHLWGYADQGTADGSDDKPFINLPSSCGDKGIGADKTTWEHDAISSASGPFNMGQSYCDGLPFGPKVTGVITGDLQQGGFPALDITVTQNADEGASKQVKVTLPASVGTNLAGLQTVCSQTQLDSNTCPAGSIVGSAKASTGVLPGELSGPAILLEQPGALPKLVVRLSGLISLDLVGTIDISGGSRIVNLFSNIPDVTLASFTLHVNGGPTGLLRNVTDLCDGDNIADAEFTAYSGKVTTASTPLTLNGVCEPPPTDIGTSARSRVSIAMAKLKSGRPTMEVNARRGSSTYASRIRSVRVTLPKALRIVRNDALESRLQVRAQPDLLPITQLTVRTRLLTVNNIPGGPVTRVREVFRKRSLRASRALARKGKAARPVFRVRVQTVTSTYNYRVRVKPKS